MDRVLGSVTPGRPRVVVPVELRSDFSDALPDNGFQADSPTAWMAEGVLYHLSRIEVDSLLGRAAALSGGRALIGADVVGTGLPRLPAMRPVVDATQRSGGRLPHCTDEPENLVVRNGWQTDRVVLAGQDGANFGRLRTAGSPSPVDPTLRTHLMVGARSA